MDHPYPRSRSSRVDGIIRSGVDRLGAPGQYGIALGLVALFTIVRIALGPVLGENLPYPYALYFPALLTIAWYFRLAPVLAATGAAVAVSIFFMGERNALQVPPPAELAQIGVFLFAVALTLGIARVARGIRVEAEQSAELARQESIARREGEEQYRTSFELAAVGKSQADAHTGRLRRVNNKLAEMTGYSRDELLTMTIDDLTHPDDRGDARDQYGRLLRGEQREYLLEKRYVRKDGGVIWVRVNAALVRSASGAPVRTTAVIQDITRSRLDAEAIEALNQDLEKRVRERTAQLESLNRELESFSYSVSHDLRAPLRHIAGFAELLEHRAGPGLDETAARHLRAILDASRHAGRLVDELLAFARMGRSSMQTQPVEMARIVEEVRAGVAPEDREVRWEIKPIPDARGDAAMLRQVWVNLLTNAVKYTGSSKPAEIRVGGEDRDGELVYFVEDNGIGFDMQYADKLFGVFQRLHNSDHFEGTGIGLANVRRIVQRHGGRTWAEGRVGRGATFYFSLPGPGGHEKARDGTEAHSAC